MFTNASTAYECAGQDPFSMPGYDALGAIRMGKYKLIVGLEREASWFGEFSPNKTGIKPDLLATACGDRPCLFDVDADPGEHRDLALTLPGVVQKLWARFNESNKAHHPRVISPPSDKPGFCRAVLAHEGWVAPWLGVLGTNAPSAVAPPPINPGLLNGVYECDDTLCLLTVSGIDPQPGVLRKISATSGDGGACWSNATGTISDAGRALTLVASGPHCTRYATGAVSGSPGVGRGVRIAWTCEKPPTNSSCSWPPWTPAAPAPPTPSPSPGPPGSWPNACTQSSAGLDSCWPTCQVRCPAAAKCCKVPYTANVEGLGCCPDPPIAGDREPGCKAGPPLPLSPTLRNVVIIGDSVSMGYTPWVQKHLGVDKVLVQHSVWGDGSTLCNRTTDPPCDPDPTGRYTGDGGDEETAYGLKCLPYMLAHPDGTSIGSGAHGTTGVDVIMFNWGLHDGPLGNRTRPGQQGNSTVYPNQLKELATRLKAWTAAQTKRPVKLLFALTSAMLCNEKQNDNVSGLNREARAIMDALKIPTVDLQGAIVGKCGPVPQHTCFNITGCFCPHCPNSLARPSPGYEWLAESTIVPAIQKLLQ